MKKEIITIIILTVFVCVLGFAGELPKNTSVRTVILSGKVTDLNNSESLAGVKISCNGTEKSFYTDLNGNFFIHLTINSTEQLAKVEFSQIGYASKVVDLKELQASSGNVSITLEEQ